MLFYKSRKKIPKKYCKTFFFLFQVAAECGTTASIRFATTTASDTDTSRLGCDSLKSKVSTEASIASEVKLRFSTAWWWILGHCLKCARRVRLTTKTELELRSKMTSGSTKRASSIGMYEEISFLMMK